MDSGGSEIVILILVLYYNTYYKDYDFNYCCYFDENVHWGWELPFSSVEDDLVGLLDFLIGFFLFRLK